MTTPLTEETWFKCDDAVKMLRHLRASRETYKHPRRKLRLAACAALRCHWDRLTDDRSRTAVVVAERYADRQASFSDLQKAERDATAAAAALAAADAPSTGAEAWDKEFRARLFSASWIVASRLSCTVPVSVFRCTRYGPDYEASHRGLTLPPKPAKEAMQSQRAILHDIFGNPFRPLSPRRFPRHIVCLAEACYEGFPAVRCDEYNVLADALTDIGEDAAADHCRQAMHVKGCHVLDWILGGQGPVTHADHDCACPIEDWDDLDEGDLDEDWDDLEEDWDDLVEDDLDEFLEDELHEDWDDLDEDDCNGLDEEGPRERR